MRLFPPVSVGNVNVGDPIDLANYNQNDASILGPHAAPGAVVFDRSLWFEGEGTPPDPDTIGAKSGDCYLDTITGDVYKLVL
jgi:hypothetical protein